MILRFILAGDSLDSYTDAFLAHRTIVRKEYMMSHDICKEANGWQKKHLTKKYYLGILKLN